jgi:predicted small secreted protein
MKKLLFVVIIGAASLAACKSSTSKTGGDVADSGFHGSSGAADTSKAAGSGTMTGNSTGGTDTSTIGQGVATPQTDTTPAKP